MRSLLFIISILLAGTASAVTIGFEGVAADDGIFTPSPDYSESGFVIDANFASIIGKDYGFHGWYDFTDSAHLHWCGIEGDYPYPDCRGNEITLSHEDEAVFSLQSFAVGAAFSGAGSNVQTGAEPILIVEGQLAGGGVLTEAIELEGFDLQTVTMSGAWTNLASVSFSSYVIEYEGSGHTPETWVPGYSASFNGEIDNIVVSVVPIPAAVWLFASALAGLGWLRQKQTISV